MEIKKLDGILEEVADTTKFPSSSKEKIQQAITAVNPSRLETDGKGAGLLFQEGQSPDNADNKSMDENNTKEYQAFVKGAWEKAVSKIRGSGEIQQEEFVFLKEANGIWHFTGTQQIRHIYKNHSNNKTEKLRGQIAITEKDFDYIPGIINAPSFIIENIKHKNKISMLYAKHDGEGTFVYVARISKQKRRKTAITFFKTAKQMDAETLIKILKNNNNYNIAEVKIVGLGGGGHPSDTPRLNPWGTVATSVYPADNGLLSHENGEKSSPSVKKMTI